MGIPNQLYNINIQIQRGKKCWNLGNICSTGSTFMLSLFRVTLDLIVLKFLGWVHEGESHVFETHTHTHARAQNKHDRMLMHINGNVLWHAYHYTKQCHIWYLLWTQSYRVKKYDMMACGGGERRKVKRNKFTMLVHCMPLNFVLRYLFGNVKAIKTAGPSLWS